MIEELWRKLRGIDHWPETEAEVSGVYRFEGRRNRQMAVVNIRYKDESGCNHTGRFRVDTHSSFYNLSMGDLISVRYNPTRPDRYWSDECGVPVQTPLFIAWAIVGIALLYYVLISFSK